MGTVTALSIRHHIRIGTVEHLFQKMLRTLHPRASCTVVLLTSRHKPARQECFLENGRAFWGPTSETDKEWFIFLLAQRSAREQQQQGCSVRVDKPGAEGDHSPGGVLTEGTQSHRLRGQSRRICTHWAGCMLVTASVDSPGQSKAISWVWGST